MKEYGIQLYSVRDAMKKNVPDTLEKVAKMGYKSVEFAGFYDYNAKEIRKMLDDNGLTVAGTHTGLNELADDKIQATMDFMHEIGNVDIVVPSAPHHRKGQQNKTIDKLNAAKPILEKEGFSLSYHNHSSEFQKRLFAPVFYTKLLEQTDICLEVDTFWAYNAGQDPLALLDKLHDRIHIIHLKDGIKQSGARGAVGKSLGLGDAPVKAVLDKALSYGFKIVVESENQDPDGITEITRCIDFLKSLD